jgi:serine protease AprX
VRANRARICKDFSFLLFLLFCFATAGEGENLNALKTPPLNPVIDLTITRLLEDSSPQEDMNLWVFFTDKGLFSQKALEVAVGRLPDFFSERALRRRQLRGVGFDFHDLPVCQEYLKSIQELGCQLRTVSRYLNSASFEANKDQVEAISRLPFVAFISPVRIFKKPLPEVITLPKVKKIEEVSEAEQFNYGNSLEQLSQINLIELHEYGVSGKGVFVGMMDSGFDTQHETFSRILSEGRLLATHDYIDGDDDVSDGSASQRDHGTCTWSAMAGYSPGFLIGPAYGAEFALAKTEIIAEEIQAEEDYWVSALEWFDSLGVEVVSSSLGYNDWYDYSDMDGNTAVSTRAADMAVSRGIVVVNAAGNEGSTWWRYIIAPADGDSVITIGAVDANGNKASFSSIGPTYDGRTKPDLMARGVATVCARPGDLYGTSSGTSLSAPLAAGAVTLLLEVDLTLTPIKLRANLRETADRHDSPDNSYGWGIIDAFAASGLPSLPEKEDFAGFFYNYPNPFEGATTINFFLKRRSLVTIQIFDLTGEVILERNIDPTSTVIGNNPVIWEGDNQNRVKVAPGIYLGHIITDHYSAFTKLVVIK